jgi:hypothetical protein
MPPSDSEILAARLARMKILIDSLEDACLATAAERETFLKLQQEIAAAREALTTLPPSDLKP